MFWDFTLPAIIVITFLTFKVWLFGSLGTSAVKGLAGQCGQTYGIESVPVISGNWFCVEKAKK